MEAIRLAPVEIGYGYHAEGRLRFIQVGDENGIAGFDQRDLTAITGGTFVHNHPPYDFPEGDPRRRAGSFSPKDLVFMWEYDLSEIIAVTAEHNYFLRRLGEGFFLDPGQINEEYAKEAERIRRRYLREAGAGRISLPEALARGRLADEVMDVLGIFYDYRQEEVT